MYQIQKTAFDLAWSYWKPFSVFAAMELEVFEELHESSKSIFALAKKVKADPDSLRKLMECLAVLELVEMKDKKYVLTSLGHCFAPKSGTSIVNIALHFRNIAPLMSRISESVGYGIGLLGDTHAVDYSTLLKGLDEVSEESVAFIVKYFPGMNVLEVGPGSGKFAESLKGVARSLVLCEKPDIAKPLRKKFKSDAIIIAQDYLGVALKMPLDRIVMSQVLHSKQPGEISRFIEKAASELSPGGMLMIREQFKELSDYGRFFAMNMQVCSGGDSISYINLKNKMSSRFKNIKLVRQSKTSPFAWLVGVVR